MTELLDFHAHVRPPWWREIAPENARTGGPFALLDDTEELLRTDGTLAQISAFLNAAGLDSATRALVGGDNARRLFFRPATPG